MEKSEGLKAVSSSDDRPVKKLAASIFQPQAEDPAAVQPAHHHRRDHGPVPVRTPKAQAQACRPAIGFTAWRGAAP